MIARRIFPLTLITIILGYALGSIPFIQESPHLLSLTPSSEGLTSRLNPASAAGLNLSITFGALATFFYSVLNREDSMAIEVIEWYGCLFLGGALSICFYWLTINGWSNSFPGVNYGRAARWLYHASSRSEVWLYFACILLLLLANLGLYLLVKAPLLLLNPKQPR